MKKKCRIIVLNYNGQSLLEACLGSVCQAADKSRYPCAVTVLDNQSTDQSAEWVRRHFPQVDFATSPSNRVFCSYNDYLQGISDEYVILLNNDIRVEDNFADELVSVLESDSKVCFAAPQSRTFDGSRYEGSRSKMEFRWGLLWGTSLFKGFEQKVNEPGLTMQCGFGAFRRSYLLELGGFDDLYLPGTVEDADLCFRAYRRGWKGLYCPRSVVYHMGQASFKKAFGSKGLSRMNRRNLYLFVWKNIRDRKLLAWHFGMIPVRFIKDLCGLRFDLLAGFGDALRRLPKALRKRRESKKELSVLRDADIFRISKII